MRFILGAISAVVVLTFGAVAFTVLNPLNSTSPSASAQLPEPAASDWETKAQEDTVTRAEASLVDTAPSTALAAPDQGMVEALEISPDEAVFDGPGPDPIVTAALAVPTLPTVAAAAARQDILTDALPQSRIDAIRVAMADSLIATPADAQIDAIQGAMAQSLIPLPERNLVERLGRDRTDAVRTAMAESLVPSTKTAARVISDSPALAQNLAELTTPEPSLVAFEPSVEDTMAKPDLRPVAALNPVSAEAPLPPVADTQPAPSADRVFVTGRRVNMRTGPGKRYDWLATLPLGAGLTLLDKNGRWYKVQFEAEGEIVTGWMAAGFLSHEPVARPEAVTEG